MKTFAEIYKDITSSLKVRLGVDVAKGTLIDSYVSSTSEAIADAHLEIEQNKTPHIYTGLKEADIDKFGYLVNCHREESESDTAYLTRCMEWLASGEASNATAIKMALANLEYSSNAEYVPHTQGVGTATVYLIPNSYEDEEIMANSLEEAQAKLKPVLSPDAYVEYKHPEPVAVKMAIYYSANTADQEAMKDSLKKAIVDHVNSIPIGEYLSYGRINKIGVMDDRIDFFNVTHIYLNDELMSTLNAVQTLEQKFLMQDIEWREAVE